jgi:dihydroorotate dehydrogenase electron transfer subunit
LIQELAPILSNEQVMRGVHLLTVKSSAIALGSSPGQFGMINCDRGLGRLLRRPISICRVSSEEVAFLFAAVGAGTEWLARQQAAETIDILGPLGNGFALPAAPSRLLLVAGGMGIAPLIFLAHNASQSAHQVKLLIGAKTAGLLPPAQLFPTGIEVITITEDGSAGLKGLVTAFLSLYTGWADRVYTCGPLPMYRAMAAQFQDGRHSLPVQLSLEVRMGCGLGFCYACTIKTRQGLKQVCRDGPVFDMHDVLWEELG